MSFRDIRLELISNDSIMAHAMRNPRIKDHNDLAEQMAEWEKTHKVTVCPLGATSTHTPITTKDNKKHAERANKESAKSASGYLNIFTDEMGMHQVTVAKVYLGMFRDINEALAARDKHRKSRGMSPAKDCKKAKQGDLNGNLN